MSEEIRPGDVVQLRSGGQKMTVESLDEDGAFCVWFDQSTKKSDMFDIGTLKRVPTIEELAKKLG